MRTPDLAVFVKRSGTGSYNPETRKVDEGELNRTERPCFIIPMSLEKQYTAYGTRNREIVTVNLKQLYADDFDFVYLTSKRLGLENERFKKVEEVPTVARKSAMRLERNN